MRGGVLSWCLALAAGCGQATRTYNLAPDEGPAEPVLLVSLTPEDRDSARRVVFTPDGRHLLALTGSVGVWEFDAGRALLQERGWFGLAEDRDPPPPGLTGDLGKLQAWVARNPSVEEIAVTPDGQHVIGGGRFGLAVWRLTPTEQPVARLVGKVAGNSSSRPSGPAAGGEEEQDVYGLAIAPDGRTLLRLGRPTRARAEVEGMARGSTDLLQGTIERWTFDASADPPLRPGGDALLGDRPSAAAFTADGRFAAVVGSSQWLGVVALADDGAGLRLAEAKGDDTLGEIVALPEDRFATGGFDQVVRLWRLDREALRLIPVATLDHVHRGKLRALAAAPDGRWLAAASDDHSLSFWPLAAWAPGTVVSPVLLPPPDEYVHGLAVHPAGPWLATAGDGLRVWRVNRERLAEGTGARPSVVKRAGGVETDTPVVAAAWTAEDTVVTAGADGSVRRWQTDGGEPKPMGLLRAGVATTDEERFVAAIDRGYAVLSRAPGTLVMVDLLTGESATSEPASPEPLRVLALAEGCVVGGAASGAVTLGRHEGTKLEMTSRVELGLARVTTLALGPDGRRLAVSGDDASNAGKLAVIGLDPKNCVGGAVTPVTIPPTPSGSVGSSVSYPGGGGAAPIAMAFAPDGQWLLTGDRDGGAATLWRVDAQAGLGRPEFLAGHSAGVFAVGFSPDGKYAVTGGSGGETYLWRLDTRTRIEALQPMGARAYFHAGAVFSPEGGRLALPGGWYRHGRLWVYELAPQ